MTLEFPAIEIIPGEDEEYALVIIPQGWTERQELVQAEYTATPLPIPVISEA